MMSLGIADLSSFSSSSSSSSPSSSDIVPWNSFMISVS